MRTWIENYPSKGGEEGRDNWQVSNGKIELRCPKCDEWFQIPTGLTVDKNGNLSDTIYHFCQDDDDGSWVVLACLVGWGKSIIKT